MLGVLPSCGALHIDQGLSLLTLTVLCHVVLQYAVLMCGSVLMCCDVLSLTHGPCLPLHMQGPAEQAGSLTPAAMLAIAAMPSHAMLCVL